MLPMRGRMGVSRSRRVKLLALCERKATLAAVVVLALVAAACPGGCGGSDGSGTMGASSESASGYVAWPMFGRVPARTHLPAGPEAGAGPTAEAGLVDQHPRADRVPAYFCAARISPAARSPDSTAPLR